MKITSSEANKLIKTYENSIDQLIELTNKSATFIAATSEDLETARPVYNFSETELKILDLQNKIRKIKHALNVFNSTTKINNMDMTIDEALIALPQLNKTLNRYSTLKRRLPKSRINSRLSSSNQIEYEYTNYNIEDVEKTYEELNIKIIKIQTGLDTINNTVQFEVEI